jgi:transcriptional regulator with XRE-family HTH domain
MSPVTVSTIGSYIREQREQAKISIRQLAQAAGVSNPYLSQVERGLRRPSADILQQIAKGLRISAEALYVQAGILDDRPADTTVNDAIMSDPELTERQKQMLIEIYESFRKEVRAEAEARAAALADLERAESDTADPDTSEPDHTGFPAAVGWPEAPEDAAGAARAAGSDDASTDARTEVAVGWPEPSDQVPAATATR